MRVTPNPQGWTIATQCGQQIRTRVVVVATATHQSPKLPELAHQCQNVVQVHASAYRSPAMLPTGRTLVVGSGQSGMQIALELRSAGREVLLATSQVGRVPRRYRGQDIIAWQAAIGFLDRHHSELESAAARFAPDPQLSGANGGQTLDLRDFAARGISLAGRLAEVRDNRLTFSDDLLPNIHYADAFSKRIADRVDAHIDHLPKAVRADVPAPEAVVASAPMPGAVVDAALGDGEIESIVWATGFRHDFSWIEAEAVFDEFGYPRQSLGRTVAHGLHFAGLNYVEHRRSGILYGAGVEATQLAEVITSDLCATALAP